LDFYLILEFAVVCYFSVKITLRLHFKQFFISRSLCLSYGNKFQNYIKIKTCRS